MDGILEAGRAQLEAGEIFAAIRAAKQVLADDPQNVEALHLLYRAHAAEQDYASAQNTIDSWLRIDPNDPDAHFSHALLKMAIGWQDQAKQLIEAFEQSFPHMPSYTLALRATWEYAYGSPDKAIELYRIALSNDPNNLYVKAELAMAYAEGRNFIAAGGLMREVLLANPNHSDALRTLAISELKSFRLADARNLAKAARAANPRDMAMKKVVWLSWLVLFPPFALGHLLQLVLSGTRYAFGNIAANACAGILAAALLGALIYSRETQMTGGEMSLQTSIIMATFVIAGLWALFVYYVFGIGNADEDKRTATMSGGY